MIIKQCFTTENVPTDWKLKSWRDSMSAVYYSLDIVPTSLDRIRGELFGAQFDAMGVSSFKADAQRVLRHKSAAQRDGSENFVFLFPTRGPLHFEQLGRSGIATPGEVALLTSGEGYAVDVPDHSENITLKIPCDRLRARIPGLDHRCARTAIANHHFAPLISQLGHQLLQLDRTPHTLVLQDTVLDLISLMLETAGTAGLPESEQQPLMDVLYQRLCAYIGRHFRDPALGPAQAARSHRISVRYLHKVFHAHGTTFGRTLLETRLDEARRLLGPVTARRRPIGEIAFHCGFINQAHFSARYRERFDEAPRDTGRIACSAPASC